MCHTQTGDENYTTVSNSLEKYTNTWKYSTLISIDFQQLLKQNTVSFQKPYSSYECDSINMICLFKAG